MDLSRGLGDVYKRQKLDNLQKYQFVKLGMKS
jgi:hypothetical protein